MKAAIVTYPLPDFARLESQRQTLPWLAARCGVSQHRVRHWWSHGLTWIEADLVACRFGRTPDQVWPEWEMPYMSWRRLEALDQSLALRELVTA